MKKIIFLALVLVVLLGFSQLNNFADGKSDEIYSNKKSALVVKEIMVANLVGRNLDESIKILDDIGLGYEVNKIYVQKPSNSIKSQYPTSGTYVRKDVKVRVYIEALRTKDKVKWLQESLKIAGFYTSRDGLYGKGTASKLNEFKKSEAYLVNDYLFNTEVENSLLNIRSKKLAPNFATDMVLVNKKYFIPSESKPEKVVVADVKSFKNIEISNVIKEPLESMFSDAKKAGFELYLLSGYRSYDYQEMLFSRKVKSVGFDKAETVVAVPGESEHQTGLAVDISCRSIQFGLNNKLDQTSEFAWLIKNSYKYGFILRYPKGKSDITGYIYEPWHYRYIGNVEVAKYIMENNLTFEEYTAKLEDDKAKKKAEDESKKIYNEKDLNSDNLEKKEKIESGEEETVVIG
ncbi:MAG: D-alanyl-D-alanine carboxypeptidase family protein [Acidaminobacteraceae bacterium]